MYPLERHVLYPETHIDVRYFSHCFLFFPGNTQCLLLFDDFGDFRRFRNNFERKCFAATVIKKKKALSISWKKQKKQVSGYQIQVSTSRKFKSKKTKNISGMKKNSTTVSKLKSRKKYYIRIRTWKKKNRKKYYSAWSKVKIGKTK